MTIRRTHTAGNVAPAIVKLRDQINTMYPKRDKASDGIWPSAAHTAANPSSDHEAGNALDIDDDLSAAVKVDVIANAIAASRDPRVNYLIHNGRIWKAATGWRTYSGSNRHTTHMHVSVYESKRSGTGAWTLVQGKTRLYCLKTHGMHIFPTWASPSIGRFDVGRFYRLTPGRSGAWVKLLDDNGKQRWGYGGHFK